jgi:hypothetical protein
MEAKEEFDGPAVSALRYAIAEVKQRWSVIGWVTKNLLSQDPPCFARHDKPMVPSVFAVVSTHQPALGPRGKISVEVNDGISIDMENHPIASFGKQVFVQKFLSI